MDRTFIERNLFTKMQGCLQKTRIVIEKPVPIENGGFSCKIIFSNVSKYDTFSKGIDEFNAVDSALDYIYAICMNSDSPEFFITESESMKGIGRNGDGIL